MNSQTNYRVKVNAKKKNNVFTLQNPYGEIIYYIDTVNEDAIIHCHNTGSHYMPISEARQHYAKHKQLCS